MERLGSLSPVPVPRFPHGEGFVELRKAFKREVCGIHVKPHVIELRAKESAWDVQNDVAVVDRTSCCGANSGVANVALPE